MIPYAMTKNKYRQIRNKIIYTVLYSTVFIYWNGTGEKKTQ